MTSTPIRRLLNAKPFAKFTMSFGFESDIEIDNPKLCRLDEEEMILYVSRPEIHPPKEMARFVQTEPATVEIIDLRHVCWIAVKAKSIAD